MARTNRAAVVGLAMVVLAALNRPAAAQNPAVNVIIRNDAGVPEQMVAAAQEIVTKIYADAGVEVAWTRGHHITIVLMPQAAADRMRQLPNTMGFAPGDVTARGRVAYVLEHRVADVARGYSTEVEVVLGAAIAHELGHLLLPINAHSPRGLMRAKWNQADFRNARSGRLLFTAGQSEQIRGGLVAGN